MKAKLLDTVFMFVALLVICAAIAYKEPYKMQPFKEIFAQVSPVQYGIPEEIRGHWYGTTQNIILDDTHLILQQAGNQDKTYEATLTLVQENFDLAEVNDSPSRTLYMINWNQTAYEAQYQEKAPNFVKQAYYVIYDQASDSLRLANGQLFTRHP